MKKNGHYYSKFLTENELERFKTNLFNFIGDDWFFNREFDSFHSFIGSGLHWGGSNEGYHYWSEISDRKVNDQEFNFKRVSKHSMV